MVLFEPQLCQTLGGRHVDSGATRPGNSGDPGHQVLEPKPRRALLWGNRHVRTMEQVVNGGSKWWCSFNQPGMCVKQEAAEGGCGWEIK